MPKEQDYKVNFINPNTPEATADFFIKLFVEVHCDEILEAVLEEQKKNQREEIDKIDE